MTRSGLYRRAYPIAYRFYSAYPHLRADSLQPRPDSLGEVVLADLDPEALGFSKLKLKKNDRGLVFTYVAGDVLQVIRHFSKHEDLGSFDAVLFGGLFDYIAACPPYRITVSILNICRKSQRK
jgi:hypothetical protein